MRLLGRDLIEYDWCPNIKGKFGHRDRHSQRENNVKKQRECHLQGKTELPEATREA